MSTYTEIDDEAKEYYEYEQKNMPIVIVYVALAVLFQPLAKIPLGRQVWNIVDVLVAVGLIVSIFVKKAT